MKRRSFLLSLATLGWAATRWRPAGAQGIRGKVVLPASPEYEAVRHVYNPRINVHPAAIAYPVDSADVAAALDWARSQGWQVAVRCGGHSYEGFSLGPGLVLDVSQLNNTVRLEGDQAIVGAGCRQRAVTDALFAAGRALPSGTCPGVGVAGYTLGGGYGLASRSWGLGCDNLVQAELVDARGQVLTVADGELFWALRGAGGGHFGVVTSLRYATHAAPEAVLLRRVWPRTELERVLEAWWDTAPRTDDRLTLALTLQPDELRLTGLFLGPESELPRLDWAPIREAWQRKAPLSDLVAYLYGRGRDVSSPFVARSDFLAKRLPTKVIQSLLRAGELQPRLILDPHGGAIARGKNTSYVHRGYPALLQSLLYYQPAQESRARAWLAQASRQLQPHVSGQAYQNYPDPVRKNWAQAAYGQALPRLKALQTSLDPDRLFGQRL